MIDHIMIILAVILVIVGSVLFVTAIVLSFPELMRIGDLQIQAVLRVWPYAVGGLASVLIGLAIVFWEYK